FLENGADGIAFGFLTKEFLVDKERTSEFVKLIHSYQKEAVFHRAFDITPNLEESIQTLISLHVDRVLTSGGEVNAIAGKDTIKSLEEHFGSQIEILAGCGINANNALEFKNYTHVKQIHSSCKSYQHDPTTFNTKVSYAYNNDMYEVVDQKHVKALININYE
ncbi:copper homeostasis protein CutC, partial [Sharpea azabuensis]